MERSKNSCSTPKRSDCLHCGVCQDREKQPYGLFALSWDIVQVNPVQHAFVANIDKKMLSKILEVSRERPGSNAWAGSLERSGAQIQNR